VAALFTRVVIPVAAIVLLVYALVDAIRVPHDSMSRAGNKLIWVLVIVLLPVFVGPLVYLVVGAPASERRPRRQPPTPPDDLI
jgi:Phospholipase_D-nuclease N-terminal